MDLITAGVIGPIVYNVIDKNQEAFIDYILINRFGGFYKNYLKNKHLLNQESVQEADLEFNNKINNININPNPAIDLIISESEIEYKNMFGVLKKTIPKVINSNQRIDEDKFKRIKDLSKEFGSEEMQEYVSWVLAGEYNNPGSFSLKTIEVLRNLSKYELELFINFSALLVNNRFIFRSVFQNINKKELLFEYSDFMTLQELGLISYQESSLKFNEEGPYVFYIGKRSIIFELESNSKIDNIYSLTIAGVEILSILSKKNSDYYNDFNKNELNRVFKKL